jgi:branched-chain amino acid transport system substrate-binding protein
MQDDEATPKAWVDWTNAHGGINGHPVKLEQFDDKGSPALAVTGAHTLVAAHVLAIVGNSDVGLELAYVPYLSQNNIPMIGGDDYDSIWETNPDLFPTMATVSVKGYADVYAAKYGGASTMVGAYCTEVAACLQDVQAQKAAAPQVGLTYVLGPTAQFVQPNYTAQCVVMAKTNAEAYYFSSGVPGIEQMAGNCQQQGFKGFWVLPQPDDTQLKATGLSKQSFGQDLQLSYFVQNAATANFRQAMSQYAPGVPLQIDSLRIWASFDVAKLAIENVSSQTLTPQTVKQGLWMIKSFTDNGITPPLTYVTNQPTIISCFELWGITNGQFVLPKGDSFVCDPNAKK